MITALGSVGTATIRNTSRSVAVTLGASVPVGDWLFAWFATRAAYDIGRPTDAYNWAVCYDTKLNPWGRIAGSQIPDISFNGTMVHIFATQVQRALVSGDVITALVGAHQSGATWVRDLSIERFSVDAGKRLAGTWAGYTGQFVGSGGGDPPAIGVSFPGPDREVLYLHGLASEGPVTDAFTWDSDYTPITPAGSNTGTPTDDITILGGYRIDTVSGNSDTVDVANTSGTRELSQTTVAMVEVKEPELFPITPVLDDFNRANESPVDHGGDWHPTKSSFGFSNLSVVSNEARGGGGSIWDHFWERCQEVYGTVSDYASSSLHYNSSGDVQLGNFEARGAQWRDGTVLPQVESHSINFGLANIFGEIVFSVTGPPLVSWPTGLYTPPVDGSKLGIRRAREAGLWTDHLFVDLLDGDGWRCVGTLCATSILALPGPLDNGSASIGTNGAWDDFGGGMIPCGAPFVPQIYRRQFGVA